MDLDKKLYKVYFFLPLHDGTYPQAASYRYIWAPDREQAEKIVSCYIEEHREALDARGFRLGRIKEEVLTYLWDFLQDEPSGGAAARQNY
jgi:hypothetical protein